PLEEEVHDVVELLPVGHRGADDVHLLPEHERDERLADRPRGRAARHEPAAALERADRVLPRGRADVFDDDVHAALVGGLEHRLRPLALRRVVGADARAERLGALALRIAGRGPAHAAPLARRSYGRFGSTTTRSPTLTPCAAAPTSTTSPAISQPVQKGSGVFSVGMPSRTNRSRWFRAHAFTRTRTSCGVIVGSGTSSYLSVSGPPNSWKRSAFIESR